MMQYGYDTRKLEPALKQLSESIFKDKPVRLVAQGEDGKVKVEVLSDVLARGATPTAAPMETTNP